MPVSQANPFQETLTKLAELLPKFDTIRYKRPKLGQTYTPEEMTAFYPDLKLPEGWALSGSFTGGPTRAGFSPLLRSPEGGEFSFNDIWVTPDGGWTTTPPKAPVIGWTRGQGGSLNQIEVPEGFAKPADFSETITGFTQKTPGDWQQVTIQPGFDIPDDFTLTNPLETGVTTPPSTKEALTAGDNLPGLLTKLYPEVTKAMSAADESLLFNEYQRAGGQQDVETWRLAGSPLRPEDEFAYLNDLVDRATLEEATTILTGLGATEDDITAILGSQRQAELERLVRQTFNGMSIEDFTFLVENDWQTFLTHLQTGNSQKDKVALLQMMGVSTEGIAEIFPSVITQLMRSKPRTEADTRLILKQGGVPDAEIDKIIAQEKGGIVLPTLDWADRAAEAVRNPTQLIPFLSSGVEVFTLGQLLQTALELEAGKDVSQKDLLALQEYILRSQRDTTWGFKVMDVLTNLIPFAGEFIATGGLYSLGSRAAMKAGTEALKRIGTKTGAKIVERALAKAGLKVVGTIAGGTLRTIPIGLARVPAGTLEKQLQATLTEDTSDDEAVWKSAVKAAGETWVEVVSESTGGMLGALSNPVKGRLVKLGLFKAFQKANPGKSVNDIKRVLESMGYHGVLGEMMEERVADVGHGVLWALGLGDQKFSIPSLEQLSVELVSFSVPGVALMAAQSVPGAMPAIKAGAKEFIASEKGGFTFPEKKGEGITPEVTKEPWMMTKEEALGKALSNLAGRDETIARNNAIKFHRQDVAQAVSEGKPVPRNVLADYPQLAKRALKSGKAPNLYGIGKAILTEEMTIGDWWLTGQSKEELLRAFGEKPLRNSVQQALSEGKPVSAEVLKDYPDLKPVAPTAPEVSLPKAEPGQPEAGIQEGMFGEQKIVRPKGKGRITQISMDEQLAYQQQLNDAEAEGLKAFHEQDPVASYRFKMGNRTVGLDSLISIREQSFPEYFTVKQAEAISPYPVGRWSRYSQKGLKTYNHIPRDSVFDELAEKWGMTTDELGDRVNQIRKEKRRITQLSEPVTMDEIAVEEAEPFQEAVSQGEPPSEAPPPPAQTVTVPRDLPELAKDSEIKRIIAQSEEQLRQDKPRMLTTLIHKVPGAKQLLEFVRPGLKMVDYPENLTAMVAEQQARAGVHAWATATQIELLNDLRSTFGNDVLHGSVSEVKFLGTAEQAKNSITGTLLDMAQNPELYDLSERQLASLVNINIHNDQMLDWVVENYGVEIGHWTPKENGAYLPNVDIGEDVLEYLQSETRAVSQGRGKTRVWATARDRMGGKTPFTPELDVQKLLEGLDGFKASAAAGQTYKAAIGGLTRLEAMETTHPELFDRMTALRKELSSLKGSVITIESNIHIAIDEFLKSSSEDTDLLNLKDNLDVHLKAGIRKGLDMTAVQDKITVVQDRIDAIRPAWTAANLKPYVFVQEGLYRYFPAGKAQLIIESRLVSKNRLLNVIEKWRAGAFSGDASPFTNQGVLGVLADPYGSLKVAGGGIKSAIEHRDLLRSFKVSALAEDIAQDPVLWSQYAELAGRGIISATPEEYATGFLSKIPAAGTVIDKFNESTFVTVTRGSFNLWKREFTQMMKAGVPELEAKVAALRSASEVYPLFNPKLSGQSEARAKLLRSLPTSISFLTKPAELIAEGSRGLAKLATLKKLSPAESSAAKLLVTMAASTLSVSATSAFVSALAMGKSDDEAWQAALDAINPHPMNGKFASIIIGDVRIPLGGPYRAIFRAIYPAHVEGIPFPVPFAGIPNFLMNRISPAIKTQIDMAPVLARNAKAAVDYNKVQIFNTKDGSIFENILRGLEYEFENFLPLTLGTVAEAIRQGDKYREVLWQQVLSQFAGTNLVSLDNTYIDRQIKQLGMPKETETKPFTIQKPGIYGTKDLYGDVSAVLRQRTGEGFHDKPLTLAIKEAMAVKDIFDGYLNKKLTSLSDNDWDLLQQRQDLADTTEFDKANPQLANISQRDYILLRERAGITDKKKLVEFDKEHPELSLNPRQEWLKSHPKENAQLAIWGQGNLLTEASYDEFKKLVKELDIPDSALPARTLPPDDSLETHFKYLGMVSSNQNSSWEAQLLLLQDAEFAKANGVQPYADWAGLKLSETPISSLELKVKNRANFEKLDGFSDRDSADYIANEKARAEAIKKFKTDNPEFVDDTRRIEAVEHLPLEPDWAREFTPEEWTNELIATLIRDRDLDQAMVDKGNAPPIFSEAVAGLNDVIRFLQGGTSGLNAEGLIKFLEKAKKTHTDALVWLKEHPESAQFIGDKGWQKEWIGNYDRIIDRIKHPEKGKNSLTIEAHVEYSKLQDKEGVGSSSAEVMLYRVDHPDYDKWRTDTAVWGNSALQPIDSTKIPVWRIDVKNAKEDAEYDDLPSTGISRSAYLANNEAYRQDRRRREAYQKGLTAHVENYVSYYELPVSGYRQERFLFNNPDFAQALGLKVPAKVVSEEYDNLLENPDRTPEDDLRMDAYKLYVPDQYIEDYVTYKAIESKGYEDDWWMMEHPEYYKDVYLGILGSKRKDYRKVPTRDVYAKYLTYQELDTTQAKREYRLANPDLDDWGQLALGWVKVEKSQQPAPKKKTATTTGTDDFDEKLRKLRELLGVR